MRDDHYLLASVLPRQFFQAAHHPNRALTKAFSLGDDIIHFACQESLILARVSLLEFDIQHQVPPGFLYHIALHLKGLVDSPGATTAQKQLAIQVDTAISKVQALLEQVHQGAKKLVMMTGAQLLQPATLSLLDDMVKHAQDAFVGQFDPTTGEIQDGVTQIHFAIQRLASMDVVVMPNTSARTGSVELCTPCLLHSVHIQM